MSLLLLTTTSLFAQSHALEEQFVYYEGSGMRHDSARFQSFEMIEGEDILFEYTSNNASEVGNHSTALTKVVFIANQDGDDVYLKDKDLLNAGAIYMQQCRCADRGIQPILEGIITGKKQVDGSWDIEIDGTAYGRTTGKRYHIQTKGTFKQASK
jgi:hypothetical protein